MKRSRFTSYVSLCAALATLLLLAGVARAQTGGQPEQSAATGYDLSWWTVDGGGLVGAGSPGLYTLSGSVGQPDAGPALSNGDYVLVGGFWGGALAQYRVYLPLVLRNM
jgi:hypothetical protein